MDATIGVAITTPVVLATFFANVRHILATALCIVDYTFDFFDSRNEIRR